MPTFAELAAQARARAAGKESPPTPPTPSTADVLIAPEVRAGLLRPDGMPTAPAPSGFAAAMRQAGVLTPPPAPTPPTAPTAPTTPVQEPAPIAQAPAPLAAQVAPQAPVPDISSRAMLVDLTIKMWIGSKTDKAVTREVARNKGADADAGRYIKHLIPDDYLEPLKKISQAAGDEHRRRTAPWGEHSRIIASDGWDDYQAAMSAYRDQWQPAVNALVARYDDLLIDAQRRLGAMFQRSEYPTRQDLERRYAFEYEVEAVPTAGDFAVSGIEQARITQQIERRMSEKLKATQADLAARIRDTVGHMAERLRAYTGTREGAFRDTLVPNVEAVIDLIPSLNVAGDPALTALAAQMRRELTRFSSADLRDDKRAREDVAEKADAILAKVQSILG